MGSFDTLTEDLQQKVLSCHTVLDILRLSGCNKGLRQLAQQHIQDNLESLILKSATLAAETAAADPQNHHQHMQGLQYLLEYAQEPAATVNSNISALLKIPNMPEDTAILLITKGSLHIPFIDFMQAARDCVPGVVVWARAYLSCGIPSSFGVLVEDICCADLSNKSMCTQLWLQVRTAVLRELYLMFWSVARFSFVSVCPGQIASYDSALYLSLCYFYLRY